MAKKFFYVCAGLFLLALTYHFGARSAIAQAGATGFGFTADAGYLLVMTPNGDVYASGGDYRSVNGIGSPYFVGNFWNGATATTPQSWGQVKDRYRK